MGKWRNEDLTDKIINAGINVHKEIGLLLNFADFTLDVRGVERERA